MDLLTLHDILEEEANEEQLLLASYSRDKMKKCSVNEAERDVLIL